jgi:hypothetical protein
VEASAEAGGADVPTAVAERGAALGPAPSAPQAPNPFLRSLVEAMRGVAEEERATNLTELKAKVEQRVEHLAASGSELAEDLRRRSELDIKEIGDWERGEIERIRGEAARKVEARRQQLEQQLVERQQQTEHEIEATRGLLSEYERELAGFVGQLTEIQDPAAFVEAARKMPKQPSLEIAGSDRKSVPSTPAEPDALSARLARLEVSGTIQPTTTEANGAVAGNGQQAPDEDESGNTVTPIVVKGLGSFGAITSFKQSLEKSGGIRAVSLSLGPTGEFVYRATHDPRFDIEAAIRSVESGASNIEREADGTVRVVITRPR